MLAMQYQITLPADYDMGIIRNRVARGGAVLDRYEGLGLKAFLIREKGKDGSEVNQYAPFYLWADAAAAASFLWAGDGFQGIVRDFGRPTVQTWVGGTFRTGPASDAVPRAAVRSTTRLPADADPAQSAAAAADAVSALAEDGTVHSAAYAIDPRTWERVLFALYAEPPRASEGELYEVLHLSAPSLNALPQSVRRRRADVV